MKFERLAMLDFGLSETAELLTRGFSGYFVLLSYSLPTLLYAIRVDGIDATVSQVVLRDGEAVGVALIARRGWSCRLAAMAIVPEARGSGVGRWLMGELISDAKARGERQMLLEVIEENTPAVTLYQGCSFTTVRRLVSYQQPADLTPTQQPATATALHEVDIREVAQLVTAHGLPNLPWQLSGESLAQVGPPHRAYQLDGAYIVLSDPATDKIGIRSLIVRTESRGQGQATRLIQSIIAAHPGKSFQVPALFPEEMGGIFATAGFTLETLAQLQMALPLDSA